jgi:hypothetical protein
VFGRCSRDSARRRRSRSVQRASIHSEISELSRIARGKIKRRKKSVEGKPSCAFSGCGTFFLLKPRVSRPVLTRMPFQTEYVRLHRTTIADPGDDAGRAGTTRAATAKAEDPEAWGRSARPRDTSCARNTSLTSGVVPYNPNSLSEDGGNTNSFFPFRRCCGYLAHEIHTIHHPSIHHPCLALLSSRYFFGSLIYYNRCPFPLSHDLTITHISFLLSLVLVLFVLNACTFIRMFSDNQ